MQLVRKIEIDIRNSWKLRPLISITIAHIKRVLKKKISDLP